MKKRSTTKSPGVAIVPPVREQARRAGRVTRELAHGILVELGRLSDESARQRLDEYQTDADMAFREGGRKQCEKLHLGLDWTYAVADTFWCADYRSRGIDKDDKDFWQKLTQTLIYRTLPVLNEIPYGEYEKARKEVERFHWHPTRGKHPA
jgi:hypothetical protein